MSETDKTPKTRPCDHLNISKLSRDVVEGDFRSDHDRVRGQVSIRVLAAVFNTLKSGKITEQGLLTFLAGGDMDSNLVPGQEPIALKDFLLAHFLPKEKKPSVAKSTYDTAVDEAKRLTKTIGAVAIHDIRPSHAKAHKEARQALGKANVSTKQDLGLLSQAMEYAVACGRIKRNLLLPVKGLPANDRSSIWPRLKDIVALMRCLPRQIKALAYFLILTGARINEALRVTASDIDWVKRTIRIPNSKRRRKNPHRAKKFRTLKIDDLGPRFEWLLKVIIKPDPVSGHLFPGRFPGAPVDASTVEDLFHKGVIKAKLDHLIPPEIAEQGGRPHLVPHDLRGGFANHGSIAGWAFGKLRAYMAQINAASIQAYLDEADDHDPSESIFVHPPLRIRRARKRAEIAKAHTHGATTSALPTAPTYLN